MPRQYPSVELDPQHNTCVGGRTIITCPDCAGNAPRYTHTHTHIQTPFPSKPIPTYLTNTIHTTSTTASICETCQGRGFNVFVCAHCNPALAEALREAEKKEEEIRKAVSASAADAATRSGDSTSSASRMGPHWRRFGDGGSGVSGRS